MDGDWPGEVTKLQLENNSTDLNHIAVSDHIIIFFNLHILKFSIIWKLGGSLQLRKDQVKLMLGLYNFLYIKYGVLVDGWITPE